MSKQSAYAEVTKASRKAHQVMEPTAKALELARLTLLRARAEYERLDSKRRKGWYKAFNKALKE